MILDVVCRYLSLFLLYINIKIFIFINAATILNITGRIAYTVRLAIRPALRLIVRYRTLSLEALEAVHYQSEKEVYVYVSPLKLYFPSKCFNLIFFLSSTSLFNVIIFYVYNTDRYLIFI